MNAFEIHFDDEEISWISAFAEENGMTFAEQVHQWTLERLEDEMDARDLQLAIEEDDGERISWIDTKHELRLS